MKYAISSDWHLHNYSGTQVRTLPDGTNSRFKDIIDCCDWMVDQALERGCDIFLHGGDVTHNRKVLQISAWNRTTDAFRRWADKGMRFHVNEGNHDQDMSGDGTSTVGALAGVVAGTYTSARVAKIGGLMVGWLPYLDNAAAVREATAKLAKQGARVLIAHLGIGDPQHSNCIPIDYEVPGHINVSDLNPELFQQVFLGHYHTAQDLAPNVRYAGSPLQLSFKEAGITKGFWTWDSETDEVDWIENTISPQYRIFDGKTPGVGMDVATVPPRDFVWVKGATPDLVALAQAVSKDREVPFRIERVTQVLAAAARISVDAKTDRDLVREYAKIKNPDAPQVEQDALAHLGAELLDEVRGQHG